MCFIVVLVPPFIKLVDRTLNQYLGLLIERLSQLLIMQVLRQVQRSCTILQFVAFMNTPKGTRPPTDRVQTILDFPPPPKLCRECVVFSAC